MAPATQKRRYTEAEYLGLERQAESRSEYVGGELFATAGASRSHNLIVTNCIVSLGTRLKGEPCKIYADDTRVHTQATKRHTCPDDIAIRGGAELSADVHDSPTTPALVIEVLSELTEARNRGDKFESYRKLPSLQTYALISQGKPYVEIFKYQEDRQLLLGEPKGLEAGVTLPSTSCSLLLAEVYDRVDSRPKADETDS